MKKLERIIIMTDGSGPILYIYHNKIHKYTVPELKAENIIDTNGAGDAFVGGFMAQFIKNKPLENCIKCGVWAAQQIIKNIGCTFDENCEYL